MSSAAAPHSPQSAYNHPDVLPNDPPPAYGYAVHQHPALGADGPPPVAGPSGETPGYAPAEHGGAQPSLADLDERELPKGWERCYDDFLGHCFYVYTLSEPVRSTWIHPLDMEIAHPAGCSGGAADLNDLAYDDRHTSIGRKLKNLVSGSSHEQRASERAAKHKLMNEQYEAYLAERRQANSGSSATRYPVPAEPYPSSHLSGRYRSGPHVRGNGVGFAQPGLRTMAFMMS